MTYWIFRYFSSRGTDARICAVMEPKTTQSEALEAAKVWAEKSTAGTACHEYAVHVKKVKKPKTHHLWVKEWTKRCEEYEKAAARRDEWLAIQNPKEF